MIGLHDKWSAHAIIPNRKFTREQSLDPSGKLRGESFRRMVKKEESVGPHLLSPIVARNRHGVAASFFERSPIDIRRYEEIFADVAVFGSLRESFSVDAPSRANSGYHPLTMKKQEKPTESWIWKRRLFHSLL